MKFAPVLLLIVAGACVGADSDVAKQVFAAIRSNDLAALNTLAKRENVNVRGERETTPLMFASAYGSVESVKLLLAAGADTNVSNAFGYTALMWSVTEPAKVKLLVDGGADVNARSKTGQTALTIATQRNGSDSVFQMLLAKGATLSEKGVEASSFLVDAANGKNPTQLRWAVKQGVNVNATDRSGFTALMNAAAIGDVESVEFLLSKGADPNLQTGEQLGTVKNGPIALGHLSALMLSAAYGPPQIVELLLKAGANVDARDIRGMTALHFALGTENQNPEIVRLLLKAGAKPDSRTAANETATEWGVKYNVPGTLKLLPVAAKNVEIAEESKTPASSPRVAAERSMRLLQKVSDSFLSNGGCMACHAQNLTAVTNFYAQAHGLPIDEKAQQGAGMGLKAFFSGQRDGLLVRDDPPGGVDTVEYALFHLSVAKIPGDTTTDSMVHNLAAQQMAGGNWHNGGVSRAPMEDSDIMRTAMGIRAFKMYSWPGRQADLDVRIEAARKWLLKAKPVYNEEYGMQLLGLRWAGDKDSAELAKGLLALQRPDGGWGQNPYLASDAYATGQSLFALVEAGGISPQSVEYQKGVKYLLRTQHDDGSWHVKSRAPKFQPYFQSGFPYDHDQWISMAGTAWATVALTFAL